MTLPLNGFGQAASKHLLTDFMQEHADSTIMIEYGGGWTRNLKCLLISKKGDTITAYRYQTDRFHRLFSTPMPRSIREKLFEIHEVKSLKDGEVNRFFDVEKIGTEQGRRVWRMLMNENPWHLRDDKLDGVGCPPKEDKTETRIYDAAAYPVSLITKGEIKDLYFDAPAFYEKLCPGRKGRQSFLRMLEIFNKTFKDKS